jgi:hypothetical protein
VAYCRVSRHSQRPDLKNQRLALEQFCTARGLANVEFLEEVGGGMNFRRKQSFAEQSQWDQGTEADCPQSSAGRQHSPRLFAQNVYAALS